MSHKVAAFSLPSSELLGYCRTPLRGENICRVNSRGAVLVVVLVCLAVAAAMFVVLVKLAATGRQSMQMQCWRMQAQWLAESGLERAAARLAADAEYTNETWTIAAEELGGDAAGVVRIRAEAVAGQPNRRLVSVEADYPDDPQHRVRCNKQIVVDVHRTIGGTL